MGDRIAALLKLGWSYNAICAEVGCSKPTVSYHARRIGLPKKPGGRGTMKYDWAEVQRFHDAGNGVRETIRHFRMSGGTWDTATKVGRVTSNGAQLIALETLLVSDRPQTNRGHLKRRLLQAGLMRNSCYECGLETWRERPIALQLDHINGKPKDNRLENLRLLCPNCHSQTETYAGKNRGRAAASDQQNKSVPAGPG